MTQEMKEVRRQILSIYKLEDGWNFGDGQKIKEESILVALAIVDNLPRAKYHFLEAFPTNDGFVSLRV
jgi:hypothetical protein